jgi:hypothetical protein
VTFKLSSAGRSQSRLGDAYVGDLGHGDQPGLVQYSQSRRRFSWKYLLKDFLRLPAMTGSGGQAVRRNTSNVEIRGSNPRQSFLIGELFLPLNSSFRLAY